MTTSIPIAELVPAPLRRLSPLTRLTIVVQAAIEQRGDAVGLSATLLAVIRQIARRDCRETRAVIATLLRETAEALDGDDVRRLN